MLFGEACWSHLTVDLWLTILSNTDHGRVFSGSRICHGRPRPDEQGGSPLDDRIHGFPLGAFWAVVVLVEECAARCLLSGRLKSRDILR